MRSVRVIEEAMKLIVEDPDIQGGAATFKGTRILVHQIGGLLAQGIPEEELREDYPNLRPEMIGAARIYVQEHRQRGGPREPAWQSTKPLSSHRARRA
jgi:uncharacterized protein (DUF433 family)